MVYNLKLKTGFFKKEDVEMKIINNNLTLETKSNKKFFIQYKDILHIYVINKYISPELEIHTNNNIYILYLDDFYQEKELYKILKIVFKEKWKF